MDRPATVTTSLIDVTSFVLLEATGDSESDAVEGGAAPADDDAASFCCDPLDSVECCGIDCVDVTACDRHSENVGGSGGGGMRETSSIDHHMMMTLCAPSPVSSESVALPLRDRKLVGCDPDSTKEVMDEVERNRLFWESCLSS